MAGKGSAHNPGQGTKLFVGLSPASCIGPNSWKRTSRDCPPCPSALLSPAGTSASTSHRSPKSLPSFSLLSSTLWFLKPPHQKTLISLYRSYISPSIIFHQSRSWQVTCYSKIPPLTARLTSSGKFMLPCLSQNNLINKKGGLSGFIPRKRELPKPFIDCGGQVWCRISG